MTGYMTVKEFADHFGLTRSRILQKIKLGEIRTERAGNSWLIPASEAERFETRKAGSRRWLIEKKLDTPSSTKL